MKPQRGNVLLQLPLPVIEWAHVTRLQPPRDTVEVECVLKDPQSVMLSRILREVAYVADAPCGIAVLVSGRYLVGLAFDACRCVNIETSVT